MFDARLAIPFGGLDAVREHGLKFIKDRGILATSVKLGYGNVDPNRNLWGGMCHAVGVAYHAPGGPSFMAAMKPMETSEVAWHPLRLDETYGWESFVINGHKVTYIAVLAGITTGNGFISGSVSCFGGSHPSFPLWFGFLDLLLSRYPGGLKVE